MQDNFGTGTLKPLDQLVAEVNHMPLTEAQESLDSLETEVEHVIPTGEGLSRTEQRRLIVEEANRIVQATNRRRLQQMVEEQNAFYEWVNDYRENKIDEEKEYRKTPPRNPLFVKSFNRKRIQQAVFLLRQRRGYEALLLNAGYNV